jgi:hypothetical protein
MNGYKYYICSMANEGRGRMVALLTDNTGQLEKFAEDHDQPGRSVYSCPNPLKDTATRRSKDDVAAIVTLHIDIDFKRLATPPDEVRAKVRALPCPFEIRESGGGLHVLANLKEAYENGTEHFIRAEQLRAQLTDLLCGDPAPNHSAALLRVLGSHNSKYGDPIEVACVAPGEPVDLTDVEAFLDLYQQPLFEVKEEYTSYGENVVSLDVQIRPIDTDAVLADMPATGEGINAVAPRLLRALVVREGMTPDEAVSMVVNATMDMAARHMLVDREGRAWTQEAEVRATIPRMTWVLNRLQAEHWKGVDAGNISADTPPGWLWGEEHEKWCAACAEGLRPNVFRNGSGWYVRRPPHSAKTGGDHPEPPRPEPPPRPEQKKTGALPPLVSIRNLIIASIPPREWLYARHYQRGVASGTVAPGGRGKSSLALVEAVTLAICQSLLGEQPAERVRVWYHNGEDDLNEIHRRLGAICQYYKIDPKQLEDWLFVTSHNEFPLQVATSYRDLVLNRNLIAHLDAEIRRNELGLCIFDPLVQLHATNELDPGNMNRVVGVFKTLAADNQCGLEVVAHTRKPAAGADEDYDINDLRGTTAIRDALRAVRVLNVMTRAEAKNAGVEDFERGQYVRIDRGKANYSAPGRAPWVKFHNETLPSGDEVGVIVPWTHPDQRKGEGEAAEELFLELLRARAQTGRYVSQAVTSTYYAPKIFAAEPEAKARKVSRAVFAAAMGNLFAAGRIRVETMDRREMVVEA